MEYIVDFIVSKRDEWEKKDKNSYNPNGELDNPFSLANISEKFIKLDGVVEKMKRKLDEEKKMEDLKQRRQSRRLTRYDSSNTHIFGGLTNFGE